MSDRAKKVSVLKAAFGTIEISRDGDDVSVKCPKCAKPGSSKKKLVINLNEGMYHCWVCGLKGRNVLRVVKMASLSAAEHPVFKKWSKPSRKDKTLDEETPELFNSEPSESVNEEITSLKNNDDNEEEDLEIPAFLRRQKN